MNINIATISGNLTRDAELRQTASGTSVLSFSVAVNERRPDGNGGWTDYPNYIDCIVFGKRAESLSRFLGKGTKVAVQGRLHQSSWEKDGVKRSKVEVVVDQLDLMSQRQSQQQAPQQHQQPAQQAPAQQPVQQQPYQPAMVNVPQQQVAPSMYDEDIPF